MFTGKWLVCIFSYNRGALLENLLASINAYYPEWDIAVFDDGSADKETNQVLSRLDHAGVVVVRGKEGKDSKHGGLYYMMNKATEYAISRDYTYAYFVQDDMQFLWRDELLEQKVEKVFARKNCLMCNSSFLQKILIGGLEDRLPNVLAGVFEFKGNGVADTGIINVQKAKSEALCFPEQSEGGNGQYWYKKGWKLLWLSQPHLAWVPWPSTYRPGKMDKRNLSTLHPLSGDAIDRLKQNNSYAFLEDYTSTERFMIKPYWYTANPGTINLLKIYLKYYLGFRK